MARKGLREVKTLAELRAEFRSIKSIVSGDTRFMAQAALFNSERMARIESLMEQQLKVAQHANAKPKRRPSAWQKFFAAGMKAGKTPAEIGAEWRERNGR